MKTSIILNLRAIFFAAVILSCEGAIASTFTGSLNDVEIAGEIVPGDARRFQEQVLILRKKWIEVGNPIKDFGFTTILKSSGGNIEESMAIGRIMRAQRSNTIARQCFSSCVLMQVAGKNRMVHGEVGVHRPYYDKLTPGIDAQQIRKLNASIY